MLIDVHSSILETLNLPNNLLLISLGTTGISHVVKISFTVYMSE